MSDTIRPSLLRGSRTWNFKALDDAFRKNDSETRDQIHRGNLQFQAARIQFYIDRFIPKSAQESFYNALEDYAHAHDLIAIVEMRRAVRGNAFAPASESKAEEGDMAATISIGMAARYPDLKMKDLLLKIEDERARVLGEGRRAIDRTTVHRHLKRVGESRRKRK